MELAFHLFMEEIKISKIIRSKRKTIAFVLTHDATLVIRAPFKTPVDYMEKLVNEKRDWIRAKLLEIKSRPKPKAKEFVSGESFFCLGKSYKLEIVDSFGVDIELKDNLLFISGKSALCKGCCDKVVQIGRGKEDKRALRVVCKPYRI